MRDDTTRRGLVLGAVAASAGLLLTGRLRGGSRRPDEGADPEASGRPEEPSERAGTEAAAPQEPGPEARARALGLEIPPPPEPVATYVPAVQVGDLLFVAGHTPRMPDGSPAHVGKVGDDLTLEEGRAAARQSALNTLATIRGAVGSLDRVERLVRTFGMVNAVPTFRDQPRVVNGFSDLMVEVFGEEAGKGVRAAVGMGSLPGGMAVEMETIWKLRG